MSFLLFFHLIEKEADKMGKKLKKNIVFEVQWYSPYKNFIFLKNILKNQIMYLRWI